ncbi:glucokinase [Stenotrophomonas mori]|uniref:Glucokinase n=1 Tax=Stenotrophomonas mori TaxID=2871096 RepID=A0ABT0SFK1_9GAMM|nr:glucokinase [Stenotrophomonas mori]MCL7713848.1 glucokinase [Stenotrophomonas mori]
MPVDAGAKNGSVATTAIIGADVGGTYARLGWTTLQRGEPIQVKGFRRYACAGHPSLAAILRDYAAGLRDDPGIPPVAGAVVAIAGLLDGDRLLNTNLAWPVSLSGTRREAGLERLELINDFVAVAQAIAHVAPSALHSLAGNADARPAGPALVLGPGTGLGVALRLEDSRPPVLASEGGHAALTAGNPLELDVLRMLLQRHGHVDSERILSGPGLMTLYGCLCERKSLAPRWETPAALVQAARAGDDPLALDCARAFCAWLGSVAGDLALTFGARSVYLTGGITGHVADWLHEGGFQQRFLAKGALAPALRQVPVWRIDDGELGVLGALAWHADDSAYAVPDSSGGVPS